MQAGYAPQYAQYTQALAAVLRWAAMPAMPRALACLLAGPRSAPKAAERRRKGATLQQSRVHMRTRGPRARSGAHTCGSGSHHRSWQMGFSVAQHSMHAWRVAHRAACWRLSAATSLCTCNVGAERSPDPCITPPVECSASWASHPWVSGFMAAATHMSICRSLQAVHLM